MRVSPLVNNCAKDTQYNLFFFLFIPLSSNSLLFFSSLSQECYNFAHFTCIEFLLKCVSPFRGFFFIMMTHCPVLKVSMRLGFIGWGDCSSMCLTALSSVPQPAYSSSQQHRRNLEASAAVCTTQLHHFTGGLLSQQPIKANRAEKRERCTIRIIKRETVHITDMFRMSVRCYYWACNSSLAWHCSRKFF